MLSSWSNKIEGIQTWLKTIALYELITLHDFVSENFGELVVFSCRRQMVTQ